MAVATTSLKEEKEEEKDKEETECIVSPAEHCFMTYLSGFFEHRALKKYRLADGNGRVIRL